MEKTDNCNEIESADASKKGAQLPKWKSALKKFHSMLNVSGEGCHLLLKTSDIFVVLQV